MIRPAAPVDCPSSLGRVLVVDDDRRVASQTAQWLCSLGWHASAVSRADEALPLLARERYVACIVDGLLAENGAARIAASLRLTSVGAGLVLTMPQASATARGATYPHQGINLLAAGLIATTTSEARATPAMPLLVSISTSSSVTCCVKLIWML